MPKIEHTGALSPDYNDTLLDNLDRFTDQANITNPGERAVAKEKAKRFIEAMKSINKTTTAKSIIESMKAGM